MKTKAVVLKFVIIALQLATLVTLFFAHAFLVFHVEETYSIESSDFAWAVIAGITVISLLLLAVIFNRYLKRQWVASRTGVIMLGTFLFLGGMVWTWGLLQPIKFIKHAHETDAIQVLQEIYKAEADFKAKTNRYGTLQELVDAKLIQPSHLNGKQPQSYRFTETDISTNTFCIHADRVKDNRGNRDFQITESGELRFLKTRAKGTVQRGQGELLYNMTEWQ